jgi:hypothetical protein
LPTIVDEAGDTPTWVPVLGVALLALVAIVVVARSQMKPDEPAAIDAPVDAPIEVVGEPGH